MLGTLVAIQKVRLKIDHILKNDHTWDSKIGSHLRF